MTADQRDSVNLEELLDRASKVGQDAEVYHVRHRDEPVLFEANRLKIVETRESAGIALRIIKDGKIGFSSTSVLHDTDGLLRNTLELVPFGPEARLDFPSHRTFQPIEVYDPETERHPLKDMIDLVQAAIDRLRRNNSDLLCDASIAKGVTTVTVLNSRGGHATYTKSAFSVSVRGTIIDGTDMLFVGDGQSSCRPISDASQIVSAIEQQLEYCRNIAPAPVGQVPVVFTPRGVAGSLLGP